MDFSFLRYLADISVEVIASFNKMKSLTTDTSLIIQAMQRSSLVEVLPSSSTLLICHTSLPFLLLPNLPPPPTHTPHI